MELSSEEDESQWRGGGGNVRGRGGVWSELTTKKQFKKAWNS